MIKPFYTYVRRTYYMSGTVLGTEDKIMNKTEKKNPSVFNGGDTLFT